MNTYAIERGRGCFEVVMYERRWFRCRRNIINQCDRLMAAEQLLMGVVGEAYSRKLDRDRFAPVTATIEDCEPRASEEHIYTAIVLQGKDLLPRHGDLINENIFDIAERMSEKKSHVERRLFLHRFMTWYARENPDYHDPRLEAMDDFGSMNRAAPVSVRDPGTGLIRRMLDSLSGRKR